MIALFMWSRYYPSGGTNDLISTFDSEQKALDYAKGCASDFDKYEIVDSTFLTLQQGYTNEL